MSRAKKLDERAGETIAAVATAAGAGGIGIVRISGEAALAVGGRVFRGRGGRSLERLPPFRLSLGIAADPEAGEEIDEVFVVWMPEGRSYTGEPTVEIQAHGGRAILDAILRAVLRAGARTAAPGEFTKRAFLSGRLDLSQAEAVAELIGAESAEARRLALRHLQGGMAGRAKAFRARLLGLIAGAEALLDFAEEEGIGGEPAAADVAALATELRALAAAGREFDAKEHGVQVTIAGPPNSGKSSLFNKLLDSSRSIVAPAPGTTRDYVSERTIVGGMAVTLVDTAGLRSSDDPVEAEGVRRSRGMMEQADVLVLLFDVSAAADPQELRLLEVSRGHSPLVVLNKIDLPQRIDRDLLVRHCDVPRCFPISVHRGDGLPQFLEALSARCREIGCGLDPPAAAPNARHQEILHRAAVSLDAAEALLRGGGRSLDLAVADLRSALRAVDEITGESATEEILDLIFRKFCVGK